MASIVIIGGGAAGCFCAAELSALHPDWHIRVLEAGQHPMAKLAVTGGGRCNITNTFEGVEALAKVYPRGDKLMRKLLGRFGWKDCLDWFGNHGVEFTAQEDHCVFPVSQDAMQIVHVLERQMHIGGVELMCRHKVISIDKGLNVKYLHAGKEASMKADAVVLATGGGTAGILAGTDIELIPSVPSLFTLKIDDDALRDLMGTVVGSVTLGLVGTRFRSEGTLLVTDWGISGPATLKLSSYAARWLAQEEYRGSLLVDWLGGGEQQARQILEELGRNGARMVANTHPPQLTDRLWRYLLSRASVRAGCRWNELGSKGLARIVNTLISDIYRINGRARFKEEFVSCGGISLSEIRPDTMESRRIPGLYLAGEVLDMDAVTGGFNLQAAWSSAWVAAHSIHL